MRLDIPFSKPLISSRALAYMQESLAAGQFSGDGPFTRRCCDWLKARLGSPSLLTHSCTAALEMAALLCDAGPGDEVIMPSFTFTSTANAFVLRGATPVFVDIRPDTLNLDERLLAQALTPRTRAIVPVHYAGVACEMDAISDFAAVHDLVVVEDAAQAHLSSYKGRPLGTLGALGCFSYHISKNIVSGEGGALLINDERYLERAHVLREKGTNRTAFLNRKVDKYQWVDLGSSYLPSDILAALLLSQFEEADAITARRIAVWNRYQDAFAAAERAERLTRPNPPQYAAPNGHIYYILLPTPEIARNIRAKLALAGIPALTHYVPLHSSPAGRKFGRAGTAMTVTENVAEVLVRLPIHADLTDDQTDWICGLIYQQLMS